MKAGRALFLGVVLGLLLAGSNARGEGSPASTSVAFVKTLTCYGGRIFAGTFNDGLFVVAGAPVPTSLGGFLPVPTSFRMINGAIEANGALYVAANEGLYVSHDGEHFARVREVGSRAVTAVAFDGRSLYATTTSALWRLRLDRRAPPNAAWWRPAGSRSLQGVVAENGHVWLASEDRGTIAFEGGRFTAYDKLAGLPTSWVIAITGDGAGGVFEATLRDGAFHLDPTGRWQPLVGLPSPWTLGVARGQDEVCVGTQRGGACYPLTGDLRGPFTFPSRIDGPDPRVHAFLNRGAGLLIGTEAGIGWIADRSPRHSDFTVSTQ